MADDADLVAVEIPEIGAVIVAVIVRSQAWGAVVLAAGGERHAVERIDRCAIIGRERDVERSAFGVDDSVELCRNTSSRASQSIEFDPPFPPDAERCAFTAEESISTCAGGPPALARAWKRSIQTPLAAQRT